MIIRPPPRGRLWRPSLVVPDRRHLVGAARAGAAGAAGRLVSGGPPGTLKDSTTQPINAGLVFCLGSHPSGSEYLGQDLVGGGDGTLMTNCALTGASPIDASWLCAESTSTSNGGIYFADVDLDALEAITNAYTIMWMGEIDTYTVSSRMISQQHTTVQGAPDPVMAIGRWLSGTSGQATKKRASVNTEIVLSDNGFCPTADGALRMQAFTVNDTAVSWWLDGSSFGAGDTFTTGNVDWSGAQPLAIMNRSATSQAEGIDGRCGFAAIWSRVLGSDEIADIWSDPKTMFWS